MLTPELAKTNFGFQCTAFSQIKRIEVKMMQCLVGAMFGMSPQIDLSEHYVWSSMLSSVHVLDRTAGRACQSGNMMYQPTIRIKANFSRNNTSEKKCVS